jgi:hypothetical protein
LPEFLAPEEVVLDNHKLPLHLNWDWTTGARTTRNVRF